MFTKFNLTYRFCFEKFSNVLVFNTSICRIKQNENNLRSVLSKPVAILVKKECADIGKID